MIYDMHCTVPVASYNGASYVMG